MQLFIRGEIDRIEEQRPAGRGVAGHGSGSGSGVDGGLLKCALQFAWAVCVVGEQVDVDVKGDQEGLVLGGKDIFEELRAGVLLHGEDILLAAAGVKQQADGQR